MCSSTTILTFTLLKRNEYFEKNRCNENLYWKLIMEVNFKLVMVQFQT